MKYYKSPQNQPFAYELDGSQDHLIPADYVQITEEEAIILGKEWVQKIYPAPVNETIVE